MDTDYNLWRDLLDTYQSLSQTLQFLWLIVPPTFLLALLMVPGWTLRRRRGSERRGWRVWQQGWQRELHESQTTLESPMGLKQNWRHRSMPETGAKEIEAPVRPTQSENLLRGVEFEETRPVKINKQR